jgi:hypothetical protein
MAGLSCPSRCCDGWSACWRPPKTPCSPRSRRSSRCPSRCKDRCCCARPRPTAQRGTHNTSAMDLSKLGETGTADNLEAYLNALGAAIPRRQMAGMLNPHCECFGELQISTQRQLSRNGSATRIFRPGSTIKDQKPEDSPTFRVRY